MSELRRHIMMQRISAETYTFVKYLRANGNEYIIIPYTEQYINLRIEFSSIQQSQTRYQVRLVKHGLTEVRLETYTCGLYLYYNNSQIGSTRWLNGFDYLYYNATINNYNNVINTYGNGITNISDRPYNFVPQSNTDIYLFGDGVNNAWNKMNGITLYDENGITIKEFRTARRNSDGELGVYCQETGEFYSNSGTGTFTAGPDVN